MLEKLIKKKYTLPKIKENKLSKYKNDLIKLNQIFIKKSKLANNLSKNNLK